MKIEQEEHWGKIGLINHFTIQCLDCGNLLGKCRCDVPDSERVILQELCWECKLKELLREHE